MNVKWLHLIVTLTTLICLSTPAFAQFQLDIEEVADAAFPVEPEETPPPRNQQIRGGFNFKANMDQWMFQPHGSEAGARKAHRAQLNLAIEMTERDCELTADQKEKLELAGEGDLARYFAEFDKIRAEFADAEENQADLNRLMQRIQPFQQRSQTSLYGPDSIYRAVSDQVLDRSQLQKLRKAEAERLKYYFGAALKTSIARAERASPLKAEQRKKILALAGDLEPPRVNNQRYMRYYVMYRLSKKKDELENILSKKQFAAMNSLLQQGKGMERNLKRVGMIE